jgi:ABC-type sugar transport system ATPase subunit
MTRPAKLIILDDPTLRLSYRYHQRLLSLVQRWRRHGTAVPFASDNPDRLLVVTDRIIVLRHGRQAAEHRTNEADREELLPAMVGTADRHELTPIMWALASCYRVRERAEELYQRQATLQRDLGAQDTLNRGLIDQLAVRIDALDSANAALRDAQRRLLTQLE